MISRQPNSPTGSPPRAAIAGAGLDWLLVMHPVSIRWLIGQDTKLYDFPMPAGVGEAGQAHMFTRDIDRDEFAADSMADAVRSYNGREPEDPMEAFRNSPLSSG